MGSFTRFLRPSNNFNRYLEHWSLIYQLHAFYLFIYVYIYSIFKFKIFSGLSFYCCTEQKLSVIPWCTLRVRKDPRFLLFRQHIGCWTVQRPGGVLWPPGLESAASDRTKDALSYRQDYRSSFKYDLRCGVSPGMRRIHNVRINF